MPEQLCYVCNNVKKLYGTTEYVVPWLCKCGKSETKKTHKTTKQRLLVCQCPVRVFARSGRKLRYCRCD